MFYQTDTVDFADLFVWLVYELDADLCLAGEKVGGDVVDFVFELRNAVFAGIVDRFYKNVVDEDVKLVAFPFANTPIFETEAEVSFALGLHYVTEIMSVVCVATILLLQYSFSGSAHFADDYD